MMKTPILCPLPTSDIMKTTIVCPLPPSNLFAANTPVLPASIVSPFSLFSKGSSATPIPRFPSMGSCSLFSNDCRYLNQNSLGITDLSKDPSDCRTKDMTDCQTKESSDCQTKDSSDRQTKIFSDCQSDMKHQGTEDRCEAMNEVDEDVDVIGDNSDDSLCDENSLAIEDSDNGVDDDKHGKSMESDDRHAEGSVSPITMTNFSIAAILKPDFGVRKVFLGFETIRADDNHIINSSIFEPLHCYHNHSHDFYKKQHAQSMQQISFTTPVDLSTKRQNSGAGKDRQFENKTKYSNNFNNTKNSSNLSHRIHKPTNSKNKTCKTAIRSADKDSGDQKISVSVDGIDPNSNKSMWPAWVFCTRYSDRPSSGPRSRRIKRRDRSADEKRPRTAFTNDQLARLKKEFEDCRYLTENRRRHLATDLGLTEAQIKIWFQNKRAKIKKSTGSRNPLALQLMAQGLYNHATVTVEEMDSDSKRTDTVDTIMVD